MMRKYIPSQPDVSLVQHKTNWWQMVFNFI